MMYSVSGAQHLHLDKVAEPVNNVLNSQLDRFQTHCRSLKNKSGETAWNVERVLTADEELSQVRNHTSENGSLSDAIKSYIDALSKLNFKGCPDEFTAAFEKHRLAWSATLPIIEKHSDLRGEMHTLFDKIESGDDGDKFKPLKQAIFDTWAEIESAKNKDQ